MSNLFQQQSRFRDNLGADINRLWEAVRALQPVNSQSLKCNQTTRGASWELNSGLLSRIGAAAEIRQFTVNTSTATTVTATTGETINKAEGVASKSDTRLDPNDTANWHPRDGSQSGVSYHYHNKHYRSAIIHASTNINLSTSIDYVRQIQKLEPFYNAGDVIYAASIGGSWVDLSANGRHWRNVFPFRSQEPTRVSTSGVDYFNPPYNFVFGTQQESDQVYSNDNPAWKSVTNFSAFDIY